MNHNDLKVRALKRKSVNVGNIQANFKPGEINLTKFKILGTGEVKDKFVIKALEASKSAIEKIKKAGGEIILPVVKVKKKKIVEEKKNSEKENSKDKKEA